MIKDGVFEEDKFEARWERKYKKARILTAMKWSVKEEDQKEFQNSCEDVLMTFTGSNPTDEEIERRQDEALQEDGTTLIEIEEQEVQDPTMTDFAGIDPEDKKFLQQADELRKATKAKYNKILDDIRDRFHKEVQNAVEKYLRDRDAAEDVYYDMLPPQFDTGEAYIEIEVDEEEEEDQEDD